MQIRQPLLRLVLTVLALGLAACQMPAPLVGARPPELAGRVRWAGAGWRTSATIGDIQANGTVALVDPTTFKTVLATQASGASGTFSFPFAAHSVTLAPGYYWLEAARFIAGSRSAGVTLRTILRYTGTDWDSISGADVQISPLTTAIARVRALDPAVTDAATMGIVVAPHNVVAPLVTYSPAVLDQLAAEIAVTVTAGGDGAGDLPLPATVSPATGTPGITQLLWTGIPLAFDFHTQLASGQDALGVSQTEMSPAALAGTGWTSVAPSGLAGPVTLRLQTGTARTLAQTWTPITATTVSADPISQLVTTAGPSGPLVAWKGSDNQIRVAPVESGGLGTAALLGTGGQDLAVGSSQSGRNHVVIAASGSLSHFRSNGPAWSAAEPVAVATFPVIAPLLADDEEGGLWGAWLSGMPGSMILQVSHWTPAGGWAAAEVVGSGATSFSLAGGKDPQIVWTDPAFVVQYSRRAQGAWTAAEALSQPGRDVADPVMILDGSGNPSVLWLDRTVVAAGQKAQAFAFRARAAGTWIDEERFMPSVVPALKRHGMALDPNGVPTAYFIQGTSPALVQICRRTAPVTSPGSWGRPVILDRTAATGLAGVAGTGRHWLFWADGTSLAMRSLPVVW